MKKRPKAARAAVSSLSGAGPCTARGEFPAGADPDTTSRKAGQGDYL